MEREKQFQEYVRHTQAVYRLTKDHVINSYWQHAAEIQRNGFVAFILRGALAWESESRQRITSPSGAVWLQSDHYDPVGKHIAAEPVRLHMQLNLNLNDIWGGLEVSLNPADEAGSHRTLERTVADIALMSNLASFLTGVSISWLPARYVRVGALNVQPPPVEQSESLDWRCLPLARDSESHQGFVADDTFIQQNLMPCFESVQAISNPKLAGILRRALSWHARGNYLGSGLNRFVNYWETIELLCHFLYDELPATVLKKPSKAERQTQLQWLFDPKCSIADLKERANEAANIVRPSIKTKLETALPVLINDDSVVSQLFIGDEKSKSLYHIRNDIAHGNSADHEIDFTDLVSKRLYEIQQLSEYVLTAFMRQSSVLAEMLARKKGR